MTDVGVDVDVDVDVHVDVDVDVDVIVEDCMCYVRSWESQIVEYLWLWWYDEYSWFYSFYIQFYFSFHSFIGTDTSLKIETKNTTQSREKNRNATFWCVYVRVYMRMCGRGRA